MDRYKKAWTKLTEVLAILDKAGCPALEPGDILRLMAIILTSEVAEIK